MGCWIIVCVEVRAQPMTKAFTRMDTSQKVSATSRALIFIFYDRYRYR